MTEKSQSERQREARLARQLRENLKRRKAQIRARGLKTAGTAEPKAPRAADKAV